MTGKVQEAAEALFGAEVGQIGIVVADLEEACRRYSALVGWGPWRCYTYSPHILTEQSFRGDPNARFSVRIALNAQQPQIELLQPLAGPSTYHEQMEQHGESLHHLAFFVDSADRAIASMAAAGYAILEHGRGFGVRGDGAFVYFDTEADLGVILEVVERPRERREPELVIE